MDNKLILRQEKYPVLQLFAALWVVFIALFDPIFDSILLGTTALLILAVLIYFSLNAIEIRLTEKALIRGNKLPFIREKKQIQQINRSDFKGVIIHQNEKKYFEIAAESRDGKRIVLAALPNRTPAEIKRDEFEQKIQSYWT